MTYEVHLADDWTFDGVKIWVGDRRGHDVDVLHYGGQFALERQRVDPAANVEPTIIIPREAARALLEALLRHYDGASDLHTVRQDLLHERDRRGKLEDAMTEIAVELATRRVVS